MKKYFSVLFFLILIPTLLSADEGMWMIQNINAALEKKMQERGLKLSANEIYNADAPGASVSDAVVALGFYCTGSIISDNGLLITNHHCAYSDVHDISTPDHNYLEDGYWAMRSEDEIPIPGKQVFFLKKVLDVTNEVNALYANLNSKGKPFGFRKVSYMMEKRYSNETHLEASLSSMWNGEKYYMALYEVYTDLRLVAAPPVTISAFGGDVDNWEWPQQKCDFAIYRVYTGPDGKPAPYSKDNIPLQSAKKLTISLAGYKPGDFTMVIGYPGRTNRYSSSSEINFDSSVSLPISNELRGRQMEIMMSWMNQDPAIRLKYSDRYFNLSNVQENDESKVKCLARFGVIGLKKDEEQELQAWIDADPSRKAKWGDLLDNLDKDYSAVAKAERNKTYYRETLIRGTALALILMRMDNSRKPQAAMASLKRDYPTIDPKLEHDLLEYSIREYYTNVDSSYFGEYQKTLKRKFGSDYSSLTEYLWNNSFISSPEKVAGFEYKMLADDPLNKFFKDVDIKEFNDCNGDEKLNMRLRKLGSEYTHALYEMNIDKGRMQYPDANFTMRISYGTVGTLEPYDAIECSWHSTTAGLLQKYNPDDYNFRLGDRQKQLLESGDWGKWGVKEGRGKKSRSKMYVDFITDNDITGGNSGSPVLNAKGELIGLAFDGNKESLASDNYYTPGYNKCVCVDIRCVLWTLDKYAGMSRIMKELTISDK